MNPSRIVLLTSLAVFTATAAVVACAESGEQPQSLAPDAQRIETPDAPVEAADAHKDAESDADADAGDGGCESLDPSQCTTEQKPCDSVDWCPATNPGDPRRALTSIWGTSKDDVWAVGSAGTVIHFDGTQWTSTPVDTTRTLFSVGGSGPNDVWIVGTYGTVYHGPGFDGGTANWQSTPIVPYTGTAELAISSVWGGSPNDIWIGGESIKLASQPKAGTQYRSSTLADGGIGWEVISPCASCKFIGSVWGTDPSNLWAVGAGGKTFHTTVARSGPDGGVGDAGITDAGGAAAPGWIGIDSQSTQDLLSVWGTSDDDVWTVGRRGTVRHYRADAPNWAIVNVPTTQDLHAVWGSSSDDIWAVGDYGTILHFDGTSWQNSSAAFPIGQKPNLYGVWGSANNDVWIVGEGILLHFTGAKK
ncbi:hypothetical protein [Labilithrix luteola]|nr:hypothetical protein [Labilithrix luteola]